MAERLAFLTALLLVAFSPYGISSDVIDPPLTHIRRAALFTPFGLPPGGGERYLLTFASVFKKLDYDVDIILFEDNDCFMATCVEESLASLRLSLKYEDFNVRLIPERAGSFSEFEEYDIFVCMGINKFPSVPVIKPVGKFFNIYICQFPFDWKRGMKDMDLKIDVWAAYDMIVVNSRYTFDWYINGVVPWLHRGLNRNIFVPTLTLLHPAVEPFSATISGGKQSSKHQLIHLPDRAEITNIALVGSFFHNPSRLHEGLKFFKDLISKTTSPIHLHYVGRVQPIADTDIFVKYLSANASLLGLPVTFKPLATFEEIDVLLSKTMITWSLDAYDRIGPTQQAEPVGNAFPDFIVESMFSGCIAVATNVSEHFLNELRDV